ncbi:cell wall hydrolase [Novosphingobium sp. JCM 18896]|uniref:cell wall hydrolase n=1 Tax=Novosphingobium sp. JCM 18896 TaxID=2989731 RepID=UPI002222A1F1|nr:cell wall hydrolase [Novosphingobium sp. JCM 18896]MCW1431473.1 cell wall hydrolase [Novosphingobium sp. JCM 18896]
MAYATTLSRPGAAQRIRSEDTPPRSPAAPPMPPPQPARDRHWHRRPRAGLWIGLTLGLAALIAAAFYLTQPDQAKTSTSSLRETVSTATKAPPLLPPVETLEVLPIGPDDARARNARQPFVSGPITAARPFVFRGDAQARSLARDCLAAGAWYEAGNDAVGQSSVVQVILNRVRHPAFPADICSTVFQGSERRTGCQFSFTCDGSMARRRPSPAQWIKAQALADNALSGFVDPRVGVATHYHTDWVVAKWSPKMEKLTKVGTHLFFRWPGSFGRPQAFARRTFSPEAFEPLMAALSPAHALGPTAQIAGLPPVPAAGREATDYAAQGKNFPKDVGAGTRALASHSIVRRDPAGGKFVMQVSDSAGAGTYALSALALCRGLATCEVVGMRDASNGTATKLAFRYRRLAGGAETAQWDCKASPRPQANQCL